MDLFDESRRQWIEAIPLGSHRRFLARNAFCTRLALDRGWSMAKTDFSLAQLVEGRAGSNGMSDYVRECDSLIDHPEFFRHPHRPYRPAAILSHSYRPAEAVVAYAEANGASAEVLPWSWYYPGQCNAVLILKKPQ